MSLAPNLLSLVNMLTKRPLEPVDELRDRVALHRRSVTRASERGRQVDVGVAHSVAELCQSLLDQWSELDETQRGLVQAACLYFVETGDDEDDLQPCGFDDDLAVSRWVASTISR